MLLLQGVLEATDSRTHPQAQQLHTSAILTEVYKSPRLPSTLVRSGDEARGSADMQNAGTSRPAWHTSRIKDDPCSGIAVNSSSSSHGAGRHSPRRPNPLVGMRSPRSASQDIHSELPQNRNSAGVQRARGSTSAGPKATVNPEDAAWEAGLLRGLTVEKCAGLLQSASVQQLMEVRGAAASSTLHLGYPSITSAIILAVLVCPACACCAVHAATDEGEGGCQQVWCSRHKAAQFVPAKQRHLRTLRGICRHRGVQG
jgi:hypothetical protein